jgi:hypothetical protein
MQKIKSNGHAVNKKRGLSDAEKEAIKEMFVSCDGIIKDDMAAKMKASVGKDVSVFQVTGAIVTFHRQVAKGEIILKDPKTYKAFMDAKRAKWASYKSDKYKDYKKRLIKGKKVPAKVLKAVAKAKPVPNRRRGRGLRRRLLHKPYFVDIRLGGADDLGTKKPKVSKAPLIKVLKEDMKSVKMASVNPLFRAVTEQPVILQEMAKMRAAMEQFYKSAMLILDSLKDASSK